MLASRVNGRAGEGRGRWWQTKVSPNTAWLWGPCQASTCQDHHMGVPGMPPAALSVKVQLAGEKGLEV